MKDILKGMVIPVVILFAVIISGNILYKPAQVAANDVMESVSTGKTYEFSLPYAIMERERTMASSVPMYDWEKLFSTLNNAKKGDTIVIHVNTYGGEVRIMLKLINLMENSKAHIIAMAEGYQMSAGYHIVLAADEIRMYRKTIFLAHKAHDGTGKPNPGLDRLNSILDSFFKDHLGMMSKENLDAYHNGEDVYITSLELFRRRNMLPNKIFKLID